MLVWRQTLPSAVRVKSEASGQVGSTECERRRRERINRDDANEFCQCRLKLSVAASASKCTGLLQSVAQSRSSEHMQFCQYIKVKIKLKNKKQNNNLETQSKSKGLRLSFNKIFHFRFWRYRLADGLHLKRLFQCGI